MTATPPAVPEGEHWSEHFCTGCGGSVHDPCDCEPEEDPEPLDMDPVAVNRMLLALGHRTHAYDEFTAAANAERAELDARHQAERAELEDRIARNGAPLAETIGHLTRRLELIGQARIAADPGAGSWQLSGGRLSVGGGGIDKDWGDDATLLAAARKYAPEAINDPKPLTVDKNKLWAALKDHAVTEQHKRLTPLREDGTVVIDGETVPGLTVSVKPRTVTPEPDPAIEAES